MHSSALYWQKRWLTLALCALGLSAVLALLLILTRTPFIQDYLGIKSWFHLVLVLHVNFAVLVWLMSFIAFVWVGKGIPSNQTYNRIAWSLGTVGVTLMLVSPLFFNLGSVTPIMSNYIPVINSPIFFVGLASFALAITLVGIGLLSVSEFKSTPVLHWSVWFWLSALTVLMIHGLRLIELNGWDFFESWFWATGHILQFVYVLVLWAVWRWPNTETNSWLNLLVLVILFVSIILALVFDPSTQASRQVFTYLMQWGMPLLLLPLIIYAAIQKILKKQDISGLAVYASFLLMMVGFVLGLMISDDSVMVTAHYHATNAAITVAFMGLTYKLLPTLGLKSVPSKAARRQILFYSLSMLLYVLGMGVSGWLGIPRKTAMYIDEGWEQLAMAIMGLGGLLSILASLVFIYLLFTAFNKKRSHLQ